MQCYFEELSLMRIFLCFFCISQGWHCQKNAAKMERLGKKRGRGVGVQITFKIWTFFCLRLVCNILTNEWSYITNLLQGFTSNSPSFPMTFVSFTYMNSDIKPEFFLYYFGLLSSFLDSFYNEKKKKNFNRRWVRFV